MIFLLISFLSAIYFFYKIILRPHLSPLRNIPGPPSDHVIAGNFRWMNDEHLTVFTKWKKETGNGVVRLRGWLGDDVLSVTDPLAANYILSDPYTFARAPSVKGLFGVLLAHGIIVAEGDDHKKQRPIMSRMASPEKQKGFTPVMFRHAFKLRDMWRQAIVNGKVEDGTEARGLVMDVIPCVGRVTLDIIGTLGLGREFNTLDNDESTTELGKTFSTLVSTTRAPDTFKADVVTKIIGRLLVNYPLLNHIMPGKVKNTRKAFGKVQEEALQILAKRKEVGKASESDGKDLVSLLLNSNDQATKGQMTDPELAGQMMSFVIAAHPTTSISLTWALFELASNQVMQNKLRVEVKTAFATAGREELTHDELCALPYLDAFCREVFRFIPAVTYTTRIAASSSSVPLSAPLTLISGETLSSIDLPEGTTIIFSHNAINQDEKVFGEDSDTFRPERWMDGSVTGGGDKIETVGGYSHLMTFIAGSRSCIGTYLSVLELKTIIAVLISTFILELREEGVEVQRVRSQLVTKPVVVGDHGMEHTLPLKVSLVQ